MSKFAGHNLIIGMSHSGKTTLAKHLCRGVRAAGFRTAVLDPLGDPDFDVDFRTKDGEEFLAYAKQNKDCFLFVDEGGSSIGRYNKAMEWLATQSRHYGHFSTFCTHGLTDLPKIMRDQCNQLFIFCCSQSNLEIAAEEWVEPKLRNFERLQQYHFLLATRYGNLKSGEILLDKPFVRYDNLSDITDPVQESEPSDVAS